MKRKLAQNVLKTSSEAYVTEPAAMHGVYLLLISV